MAINHLNKNQLGLITLFRSLQLDDLSGLPSMLKDMCLVSKTRNHGYSFSPYNHRPKLIVTHFGLYNY